jgi:hypothetical protein
VSVNDALRSHQCVESDGPRVRQQYPTVWRISKAEDIPLRRGGRPRIPAGQRQAIIEELEKTHNASEAARRNDVSPATAQTIAKAEDIALQGRGSRIPAEQREAVIKALKETNNALRTSRLTDVPLATTWRIAKEEDIPLQGRGRPPTISAERPPSGPKP